MHKLNLGDLLSEVPEHRLARLIVISALNLYLSLSATARWADSSALISSTQRLRFGNFARPWKQRPKRG